LAGGGEAVDGLAVDCDAQGDPAGGLVVADLELEAVEEFPFEVFGQSAEVGVDDG